MCDKKRQILKMNKIYINKYFTKKKKNNKNIMLIDKFHLNINIDTNYVYTK